MNSCRNEKCDSSKQCDRVAGFGGRIRARDLRGPALSKAELVSKQAKKYSKKKVQLHGASSILCLVDL